MDTPKISVIIPVYNVEPFIHRCVESVLKQTYTNIEVILVDDESPDNCGKICDEFAGQDNRIKVIHQKNKGLSGARNAGLKIATGDFISFLDSDDWLELDTFEVFASLAKEHDLDMLEFGLSEASSHQETINHSISDLERKNALKSVTLILEDPLEAYKRVIRETKFSVWRRIYRHDAIRNYLFLEGKTSEDVYFFVDNTKKFKKLGYFPFPFYNYGVNPTSITRKPYSLKDFDALDAAFYLYNSIMESFPDQKELQTIAHKHLLKRLLRHYRLLNYNATLDPDYAYRKEAKKMIDQYYRKDINVSTELKLAKYLPLRFFRIVVGLHKVKLALMRN